MKKLLIIILVISYSDVMAQITLKTEYFGKSSYRVGKNDDSNKVGNSEGSALVYQAGINLPISVKQELDKKPTVWGVAAQAAHVSLDNRNFTEDLVLDEITNVSLNIYHLRPLNEKWSMMASLGAGIFSSESNFSQISSSTVLGNVAALFIHHLKPNLDLGIGLAFNNSFGYPMAFPALYLKWAKEGKYSLNVSLLQGLDVSVKYELNKLININYIIGVDGQAAFFEEDNQDKMFTHQYIVTGIQPEIKLGKNVTIPFTAGINTMRTAQKDDRKLESMFRETYYYFQVSPYFSAGINYNF
ncbi:hypothetical protein GCM10011506_20510 [Marivirga lumbricoides]|uniref:DUF6268 domain-containing protein n=1 Tax=Marivirga lumbricoides TaxID=1046115 RepID=A0ABQ1M4Y5_9BACT|nr:hypothetical protein GCM10011506_20510 [Marivirga lumbricoides]